MYQGVAGIDALNDALQDVFNPCDDETLIYRVGRKEFRIGDKILQLKNRPDDEVFNGDIGTLIDICLKDNFEYLQDTLVVDFDGILLNILVMILILLHMLIVCRFINHKGMNLKLSLWQYYQIIM